ncbi:NLI interacting factor-like phosphatase domain-containing protein [Hirsutella rhossiliensis]|uniref:Mitochondrial import inner membrane translocase subunit TIM50 n=1 Tax=Hirsutella rhossiliensis TaxID=111463 RepID=A0A9P8SNM9_9HYPO|nr:NLI interacting factor-like phosphatase domain-containing protein [Hirsutella rhossiliensis]KAH0968569.1 NLI interacting factor-like phosphatase domain-containing protein [Hirsutella rhossiliensis]
MLSRIARASRLASATPTAARSSRSAVFPTLRAPAAVAIYPSARTYASNHRKPGHASRESPPKNSSQPSRESSPQTPPQAAPRVSPQTPPQASSQASSSKLGQDSPKEQNASPKKETSATLPRDASQHVGQTPFHKLPDLTQGIPSTLEQEMQDKAGRSPSALQAIEQEDSDGRGPRERKETYIPSSERNRRWWTRLVLLTTAVGSSLAILYMGRNWEDAVEVERHPDAPNGFSPTLWWQRMKMRMSESVSYYQDPAFDKLLPDPDPSFERPYTLCLSLDDLLIHSEWSREHGWRIAKRPGMDYFVRYLSQYFELVLFTTVPFMYGESVVRKLDPFRFIMWPLYREATKFEDGEIVKDLSYLNRDLSKVIIIDTNRSHVRKQPENAIILEPWKGDPKDSELVGLIPFLEYIHTMQYSDVRKVLKSFEGKHIPTEFARREAIARKEFNAQLKNQKAKHSKPSGVGALGNMLGLKPSNMSMTMDLARERGQRNYELLEKEIRENGEKWLKEEQVAMEKAQKEAMSSMMGSFSGWYKPKPNGES